MASREESLYKCGCSEFGDNPVCSIHGKPNISTIGSPTRTKKYYSGKKMVVRGSNLKKVISYLPKKFDYLNIDCTQGLLNDKDLVAILDKASSKVFVQVDVTGLDSIAMVHTQFEIHGLKFAGESVLLSEMVGGYYAQTVMYFYHKPKRIESQRFNMTYLSESNHADQFWIGALKCKRIVYLNVSTFKVTPIVENFEKRIFVHTEFHAVAERIMSTEFKKLFPIEMQVPKA